MHNIVISDTSSLILFDKIQEFELLRKVYKSIITTPEIAEEFGDNLPNWIQIVETKDKKYQELIELQVDKGEASAITLAKETENVILLLDDLKARKLAAKLNLKYTGVLGVFHKAKQVGIITEVKPLIEKLQQTNFRIAENVIQELLRLNNE